MFAVLSKEEDLDMACISSYRRPMPSTYERVPSEKLSKDKQTDQEYLLQGMAGVKQPHQLKLTTGVFHVIRLLVCVGFDRKRITYVDP